MSVVRFHYCDYLINKQTILFLKNILRVGEVVTRQAHNLKNGGANPSLATNLLIKVLIIIKYKWEN